MICSFCSSRVLEGTRVCPQCGAPQPLEESRRRQPEPSTDTRGERPFAPDPSSWTGLPGAMQQSFPRRVFDLPRGVLSARHYPPGYLPLPVRSFRINAFIAFVLYFPFFLPGLIASAVWWIEAKKIEHRTGLTPPGKGCLSALLLWGVIVTAFWVMAFAFV